ncbi:MAG: glycosyltransferase family 2 protein [Planctomycetes bacterium]|nr:glycosyltransferase family 2 protein [Planctomycetota bacterium]
MTRRGATVAVILFNGREHVAACLEAVKRLEGEVAEILVVDNASTDGGPEWIGVHHPDVRLVALGANRGPAAARNRALAQSRTARVYLLDCDTVPAADSLRHLSAELDAHPGTAIAQPRALFAAAPERIHYDAASFSYTGLLTLHNFGAPAASAGREAREVDAVISMALLVDRDRLQAAGPPGEAFDELYFLYFEDTDLSYRLKLMGGSLRLVPAATVLHREGTAGVSYRAGGRVSYRRAFLLSRNRWLLLLKTLEWRTFWLTLPAQLAYEAVLLGFLTVQGQPHGWLMGKLDLIGRASEIRARRRATQAVRTVRDGELLGFKGFSFVPGLDGGAAVRLARRVLDGGFGLYWKLVRWLV